MNLDRQIAIGRCQSRAENSTLDATNVPSDDSIPSSPSHCTRFGPASERNILRSRGCKMQLKFDVHDNTCIVTLQGRFATGSDSEYRVVAEELQKVPARNAI